MTVEPAQAIAGRDAWEVPAYRASVWKPRHGTRCVVVPVLDEGERIGRLLDRMDREGTFALADVIVVDGGSVDGSTDPARVRGTGIRALVVKEGPGRLSAQLRCAYAFALDEGYESIVTIDGNDKDDPRAVAEFFAALEAGTDFVQASRFVPGGVSENTPVLRWLAIRAIHAPMLSWSSGFRWTDTTQGFRGYTRALLADPRIAPFRAVFQDYELLAYLSCRAPRLGYRCRELPSTRRYPKGPAPTKIRGLRGNLKMLATLVRACAGRLDPPATA